MSLKDKKVLITRPKGSQQATMSIFSDLGALVNNLPMVRTVPTPEYQALDNVDSLIKDFRFVVLSSPRGAQMFCDKAGNIKNDKIVAIGPGTARVLKKTMGVGPIMPESFDQEGLVVLLTQKTEPGDKVLYFGATKKRNVLQKGLRQAGIEAVDFAAYNTECVDHGPSQVVEAIKWADFVCFFSPSGVNCMKQRIGADKFRTILSKKTIAAIGHVTAAALNEFPCLVPPEHTPQAMANMLNKM